MKRFKFGAAIALVAITTLSAKAAVEKPIIMDEAMLSVTVSDLQGFIDGVGGVAAQIQPGMNGAMLKTLLGMQVGDMGLAGMPAGSGLSIVALDMTNIFAVIEVAEAQSTAYLNMAEAKGLKGKYEGGVLVVASSPEVLTTGVAKSAAVKSTLLTKRSPTLRLAMQPAEVITRNQKTIDGFMAMMPTLMGQSMMQQPGATLDSTQSVTKILEGELLVLLSLSKQCEAAEVVLTPKNGGLSVSETFVR